MSRYSVLFYVAVGFLPVLGCGRAGEDGPRDTQSTGSDVDNDGRPDLLLTLEWGAVKLFRNVGGKLEDQTDVAGLTGRMGWWNSITGGDFDGDDDIDYVVMNVGLNTNFS